MLEQHAASEKSTETHERTDGPKGPVKKARKRRGGLPTRSEPKPQEVVPVLDDHDTESVAFRLWSEGRTDDAIAFLEREILLEKDRFWKHNAGQERIEPRFTDEAPAVIVPPPPASADSVPTASGRRRKRGKAGIVVSEPAFSDASAPIIELSADRVETKGAKTFLEFTARMPARVGRAPAWIAVIGLIAVGFAAAANFWNNREIEPAATVAAPAVAIEEPAKEVETQTAASVPTQAASVPAPTVATPAPDAASPATPAPAALTDAELASVQAVSVSAAPSEDTVDSENAASVETSPPAAEEPAVVEEPQPAASLGADEARVVIAEDASESVDTATPPDEFEEAAIDPTDSQPVETVETARLPRLRPEPPATAVAMSAPRQERPLPAPSVIRRVEPTTPDAEVADSRLPLPFYDSQGMPRRQTLSPEEYQVLLRRRAWLMRQHAIADESMLEDRPLLRLLRR